MGYTESYAHRIGYINSPTCNLNEQLDPSIHIGNQIQDIESMVDFLLENGADVGKYSKSKGTALDILIPLEIADFDATLSTMRKLIENGADANFVYKYLSMIFARRLDFPS
jgi:hypothetical protein